MRIGICSDTHGNPLPEFPSDCELILHAGDLYDFDELHDVAKARRLVEQVASRKVAFVRGNHDITDHMRIIVTADLSGKLARLADWLWVVGIGIGCGNRKAGGVEVMTPTEGGLVGVCNQVLKLAVEHMKEGDRSILLTHYPARLPDERLDEGFRFDCVFKVAQALRPLAIVQGHTHRDFGRIKEHDGLTFIHPGPQGMILEVTPNSTKTIPLTKITDNRRSSKQKEAE
jgi:calcineurin-like phosphoesterase family protein